VDGLKRASGQAENEDEEDGGADEHIKAVALAGKACHTKHDASHGRSNEHEQAKLNDALRAQVKRSEENAGNCAQGRVRAWKRSNRESSATDGEIEQGAGEDHQGGDGNAESKHRGNGDIEVPVGRFLHQILPVMPL